MAELRLRIVDAFTDKPFTGNPAAVVVLDENPTDAWMSAVARETNLSDTGFVIRETLPDADFRLRWFTPVKEAELCGHATLASAHCLFEDGVKSPIRFATRSGVLTVTRREDGSLAMDFPAAMPEEVDLRGAIAGALGAPVEWTGRVSVNNFKLALLTDERGVRGLTPDLSALARQELAVIATAVADPGRAYDFVSRVFSPGDGINEDPVTGSSHTVLAPFWSRRLGKTSMLGIQLSARSGVVGVELHGDRVVVIGRAVTVLDGVLRQAANPN